MFFLSPLALLGLAAALVPPLLHLFQRRRPPDVVFPAVRYLRQTTREAQRSIRLKHLLLMLLRVVAVVLLVLAAARPVVRSSGRGLHEPTAVALIVDNSLSSAAVVGGTRVLDELKARANETLGDAAAGDALWLVGADGIARRGSAAELRRAVGALEPDARRLDLAAAIRSAARLVRGSGYVRGEVHLLSDLQATGFDSAAADSSAAGLAVLVVHPPAGPPPNRGVASARARPAAWVPGGGSIEVTVGGGPWNGERRATVTLQLGSRGGSRAMAGPGEAVALVAPRLAAGWASGEVVLDPDELLLDDRRPVAVRVLPPARVSMRDSGELGQFVVTALGVLAEAGQIELSGAGGITIGVAPYGCAAGRSGCASIVLPPSDPVRFGALNRALAAANVPWRYGDRVEGAAALESDEVPELAGARITARVTLEPVGAREEDVIVRAGTAPWLVRHGGVVLVASQMRPEETSLPLGGSFVPALNALVNRVARGEAGTLEAAPGAPVRLPGVVTGIEIGADTVPVEPGSVVAAPARPGVYALLAGRDTAALLVVAPDPRESRLERADAGLVRRLFPGAEVEVMEELDEYAARRFRGAGRSELTGWFLALALAVLLVEAVVAAGGLRRGS